MLRFWLKVPWLGRLRHDDAGAWRAPRPRAPLNTTEFVLLHHPIGAARGRLVSHDSGGFGTRHGTTLEPASHCLPWQVRLTLTAGKLEHARPPEVIRHLVFHHNQKYTASFHRL